MRMTGVDTDATVGTHGKTVARSTVKEAKSMGYEEEEERTFVPSAVSVPLKPLFRCDNQCSEKTLSYRQLASVVVDEGR